MAWGGLNHRAFSTVLVLGVKAADRAVMGGFQEGAAIHHLSNQNSFLCSDDIRLLLGQRQVRLLIGSTQLYHTVDKVLSNLFLDICTIYSQIAITEVFSKVFIVF